MFQFAGFASRPYGFRPGYPCGWVAPFGDPGINERSPLPPAFRSVPRPSSPLSAKASTRCPYLTLDRYSTLSRACARTFARPHAPSREDTLPPRRSNHRPDIRRHDGADRLGHAHTSSSPCQTALAFPLHQRSKNIAGQDPLQGPAASRDLPDRLRRNSDVACIGAARSRRASTAAARRRSLAAASVVEVNGIEPMTSCLQSRRSPN
jgi:hypothetical protein